MLSHLGRCSDVVLSEISMAKSGFCDENSDPERLILHTVALVFVTIPTPWLLVMASSPNFRRVALWWALGTRDRCPSNSGLLMVLHMYVYVIIMCMCIYIYIYIYVYTYIYIYI